MVAGRIVFSGIIVAAASFDGLFFAWLLICFGNSAVALSVRSGVAVAAGELTLEFSNGSAAFT